MLHNMSWLSGTFSLVLLFILQSSYAWMAQARASDLSSADTVSITLENHISMLCGYGKIPLIGRAHINIFLAPATPTEWSTADVRTGGVNSGYSEKTLMSSKLLVTGGIGKSIISASAEMYDAATHTWLTKGRFVLGRRDRSSALPFSGRVLVWAGVVFPF